MKSAGPFWSMNLVKSVLMAVYLKPNTVSNKAYSSAKSPAVACVARLQRVAPSLLPFRAVAVGDDTNDHPSSSIEKKKKTQAKRTSAYRQTTSPPPRSPSMPRSDARFRDAASKLSSPVKTSAAVEVTAAAVTEASVEVTVKAEEEARTFLLLSLLPSLLPFHPLLRLPFLLHLLNVLIVFFSVL